MSYTQTIKPFIVTFTYNIYKCNKWLKEKEVILLKI